MTDMNVKDLFNKLEQGLALDVHQYLECYYQDLRYQYDAGGRDYVNDCSSGTPYFNTEDEAKAYIDNLATVVAILDFQQGD
tara:strand:+ start:567 stop:809 length:243 start_codon:yes stop_codon:yes gene_type:complete